MCVCVCACVSVRVYVNLRQKLLCFVLPHASLLLYLYSVPISLHLQLSHRLHQLHTHTHTHTIRRTFRTNTDTNMPQFQQHTPEPREPLTGACPPGGAEPAAAQMEDPTDWRTAGAMRRGIPHHRNSITSTVHV